jgi:hypothetical protein
MKTFIINTIFMRSSYMNKLIKGVLFLSVFLFLSASVSADTVTITSQYMIGDASAVVASSPAILNESAEQINEDEEKAAHDIVSKDLTKLKQENYTLTKQKNEDFNPNDWYDYIVNLALDYRSWDISDTYKVYRTNMVTNTGRNFIVYTYIIPGGSYNTYTLEFVNVHANSWAFEISK